MASVICNIPHASLTIPEWAKKDFIIPEKELILFADKMADKDIDRIFAFVPEKDKIISDISRVVVDMERYRDDSLESMAKLGMGLFYEKDDIGNIIRNRGETYAKCLNIYDDYHARLTKMVEDNLKENMSCYILDCHSFHDGLSYTGYDVKDFPDICIGHNYNNKPDEVLYIEELFRRNHFSVSINMPFSGSIVPMKYSEDNRVHSIMLEINRRVYCDDEEEFIIIQNLCKDIYYYLKIMEAPC